MDDPEKRRLHTASAIGHAYLTALQELIGENGLRTVFRLMGENGPPAAAPFEHLGAFHTALQGIYGERTAANLSHKAGAMAGERTRKEIAPKPLGDGSQQAAEEGTEARLGALARYLEEHGDEGPGVEPDETGFVIALRPCPYCEGVTSPSPFCHAFSGFLDGFLKSRSSDQVISVEEIRCCASGADECAFHISTPGEGQNGA